MWLWRTKDNEVREFANLTQAKKCPICGQYFKKHEKAAVIVPPMHVRKIHKKLNLNSMVHLDEWIAFVGDTDDGEMLAQKFAKHKTPRVKPFTEEEIARIEAFSKACYHYGFFCEYKKPYGIKIQKRGTSVAVEYNVFTDIIDISHRGKRGLFDSIYERQITTNIYNKMHEILADGKHDDFSASKTIANIAADVNKSMKDMGF